MTMDPLIGWAPTQLQKFWEYPRLFRQIFHLAKLVFGPVTAGNGQGGGGRVIAGGRGGQR